METEDLCVVSIGRREDGNEMRLSFESRQFLCILLGRLSAINHERRGSGLADLNGFGQFFGSKLLISEVTELVVLLRHAKDVSTLHPGSLDWVTQDPVIGKRIRPHHENAIRGY